METRAGQASARRGRAPHLPLATRRELVLDAARQLLLEGAAVSMDSVAVRAGVAKTVVYRCFDNRDGLLEALCLRERGRLARELDAALEAARPGRDPAGAVHRFLEAYYSAVTGAPDSYRLIYGPNALPDRISGVGRARTDVTGRLAGVLTSWLDPGTAPLVATLAVGTAETGARLLLEDDAHWSPEQLARRAATLFAGGVPALVDQSLG
ncbi:TetR/AcrR family transcriptional regulator [Nocardiopsis lucentensis]|uniref:TetR/AcrR family transcriptional regulator n=1 Tax=Nocardiopsis lucentensis TaxID=53441 RepID=UPI00034746CE|nr:TetR/AcrR family transcriptional regulator [Nocardiopsis lucentensis]